MQGSWRSFLHLKRVLVMIYLDMIPLHQHFSLSNARKQARRQAKNGSGCVQLFGTPILSKMTHYCRRSGSKFDYVLGLPMGVLVYSNIAVETHRIGSQPRIKAEC